MKLLVIAVSLFLSLTAFAQNQSSVNWYIVNLDTGRPVSSIVKIGDSDWSRLVMGDNCIDGDLEKSFVELKIIDGSGYTAKKNSLSKRGIEIDMTGPYCVREEASGDNHRECAEWKVETRPFALRACDPNQKFFEAGTDSTEFVRTTSVLDISDSSESNSVSFRNVYYSGKATIERHRRVAYLNLEFYDPSYGLDGSVQTRASKIRLVLKPEVSLSFSDDTPQTLAVVDFSTGDFGNYRRSRGCAIVRPSERKEVSIVCSTDEFSIFVNDLPLWLLGVESKTEVSPVEMPQQLKLQDIKTGKKLKMNEDYKSLSELWLRIKEPNGVVACVYRGDQKNMRLDLLSEAQTLLSCGTSCNKALGVGEIVNSVGISKKGLLFSTTKTECIKEDYGSQDSYACLKSRKTKGSFLIPVCK